MSTSTWPFKPICVTLDCLISKTHLFLGASPDGSVYDPIPSGYLEIKGVSSLATAIRIDPNWGGGGGGPGFQNS